MGAFFGVPLPAVPRKVVEGALPRTLLGSFLEAGVTRRRSPSRGTGPRPGLSAVIGFGVAWWSRGGRKGRFFVWVMGPPVGEVVTANDDTYFGAPTFSRCAVRYFKVEDHVSKYG